MKKYYAWGVNFALEKLVASYPALCQKAVFIDNYKTESIDGDIKICKSDILNEAPQKEDCIITIFANIRYDEIYNLLVNIYQIPQNNIVPVSTWMHDILVENPDVILRPQSVRIEACSLCQLDCVECYMRKDNNGTTGSGYLKYEDFKRFIENNDYIRNIELANSGEVFLNRDLKKIIMLSKKKGIKLSCGSGVNFNYLSDEVTEEIVSSGCFTSITISLDGASQETYEQYRRKGDFEAVINNIKKINDYKKKYQTEYPVLAWKYILFPHNEHEVRKAKEMAEALDMQISFVLPWGDVFTPTNREELEELTGLKAFSYAELQEQGNRDRIICCQCQGIVFTPQINWDGRLMGCCCDYKNDWKENAFEKSLEEVLNSKEYRNNILRMLGGEETTSEDTPCEECGYCLYKRNIRLFDYF